MYPFMSYSMVPFVKQRGPRSYLFFLFLAFMSMYHPHPTMADQSGGMRRIAVRARPISEDMDEVAIYGSPPKMFSYDPQKFGASSV